MVYYDGQFDDARLLINMVATAAEQGATLLNYCRVTGLTKDADGFVNGVCRRDEESGDEFTAAAKVVVNATGPFTDGVRRLADLRSRPMIAPSQGIHLVFDRSFLPGDRPSWCPTPAMAVSCSRFLARPHAGGHHRHAHPGADSWSLGAWRRRSSSF